MEFRKVASLEEVKQYTDICMPRRDFLKEHVCKEYLNKGDSWEYLVAVENQTVVGGLTISIIHFFNRKVAFVAALEVLPQFRRQGVATQLIDSAKKWGREKGCSYLSLTTTFNDESPEVKLYKKCRFNRHWQFMDYPL